MPQFFRKDSAEYWGRYPAHLQDMATVMGRAKLTPATMHVMGEPTDETAPAALIFTIPPGGVVSRHAHDCERFEIILEGSLLVDDMVLGPGDVMVARPGEFYGPHVAGPDGCRTLEIFSKLQDAHQLIHEGPDGPVTVQFGTLAELEQSSANATRR